VESTQLTRYANSAIHQNLATEENWLWVKAIKGKKIGLACTNLLAEEAVEETVKKAEEIAAHQKEKKDFISLPYPKPVERKIKTFFESIETFSPLKKAEIIKQFTQPAEAYRLKTAGAFATKIAEMAVMNSLGVEVYQSFSWGQLVVMVMNEKSSGYAQFTSRNLEQLEGNSLAEVALKKCLAGKNPVKIEPRSYTVILEEEAVATLVKFLAYLGFSALAYQEGRSFLCGRLGERITGENISIWDDGWDEAGLVFPFDFEGMPKKRVELIKSGYATGLVYDSFTAYKEKKESTGHALSPSTSLLGPYPTNLFLQTGDKTKEEMIAETEYGLLITRFHYTNVIDPMKTIITGMTRDGTFLVKDGKIVQPVVNLRFTESILNLLSLVVAIGKEWKVCGEATVPVLKIEKMQFTGTSE
jgi:predicted Zn-dependent protease